MRPQSAACRDGNGSRKASKGRPTVLKEYRYSRSFAPAPWMEPIVALEAAITILLSFYNFRFLHSIGLYRSILCWQFTIMSLHVAVPLALQLALPNDLQRAALVAAVVCSWMVRSFETSIFSLFMLFLELSAGLCASGRAGERVFPWMSTQKRHVFQ